MHHLKYWIGFNRVAGIGPVRLQQLLAHFEGDLDRAWRASASELAEAGLDRRSLANLQSQRVKLDLERELSLLEQHGVTAITWNDERYPRLLREIPAAPPVIYLRGQQQPQDDWAVAIVGTRKVSAYGRRATEHLASALAEAGLTIVSGLALGVDRIAHEAALNAGGRTIAVLANGVERPYPMRNRKLGEHIVSSGRGLLLSDYPIGTPPEAANFPPRNRIISGLSLATVIVEAGERSGALITAGNALDQGRDVFAVPGSIFSPGSQGTNRLIQEGAMPVLKAQDVLDALDLHLAEPRQAVRELVDATPTEEQVLGVLGAEPRHIDDVGRDCGLQPATLSSTLALLELKGMVARIGSMNYIRL